MFARVRNWGRKKSLQRKNGSKSETPSKSVEDAKTVEEVRAMKVPFGASTHAAFRATTTSLTTGACLEYNLSRLKFSGLPFDPVTVFSSISLIVFANLVFTHARSNPRQPPLPTTLMLDTCRQTHQTPRPTLRIGYWRKANENHNKGNELKI